MSALPQTVAIKPSPSRHVTAVLGPTNTGKTHLAIERMLGHESGLIGLPLRLLAREIYDKIVARIGPREVALITGEEKIKPERPRYYVCTVEAMPRDVEVDFLAVDEIQLAADPDRGHVFTDRLFHSRGMSETLLLGAQTMAEPIRDLIPGANFISRPRLSRLTYAGQKKITRLPSKSAIVAFSANDVYAIAELIRRQRGGAAVVLGALSPRTRNAQVALYQSGEVDFLVATDAVGMGLNLDVDHVAFAGTRKFDGRNHRSLTAGELGQIAGRAGRHLNDGTFGVTADAEPFDSELINKLENHEFEPVKVLQWRNTQLDFGSLPRLTESLRLVPGHERLVRARTADDLEVLELAANDAGVAELAVAPAAIKRLWDVCQVPDYRKVAPASHAELVSTIYKNIMSDEGVIPEDWFAAQVDQADRTDGDIDTLSTRIAHIRTWTFVSNRREWLKDPDHWQSRTREVEDRLSDALHEQLTQRFVDKRTSVLMKNMRDKDSLYAEIEKDGRVVVEKHYVGKLDGFRFTGDAAAAGVHAKAARNAAAKVLVHELAARADRLTSAPDTALHLTRDGAIVWENQEIGRIQLGDDPLKPGFSLHSDEHLAGGDKENITARVETWLSHYIEVRIKPLVEIAKAEDVTGLARGIAFRLRENFGSLKRETVADEIKSLDQDGRAQLRKYGVRFGAQNIYFPLLLKPAAADLLLLFWILKHGGEHNVTTASIANSPRQGLTSIPRSAELPEVYYRASGFNVCGPRAVRFDMLERLADIIRPLTAWKPSEPGAEPPPGAVGGGAFKIKPEMMSIMGCSSEELGLILESLGYRRERRPVKKPPVAAAAVVKDGGSTAEVAPVPSPAEEGTPANDNSASSPDDAVAIVQSASGESLPHSGDPVTTAPDKEPIGESESDGTRAPVEAGTTVQPDGLHVSDSDAHLPTEATGEEAAFPVPVLEPEFEEIWRFRRVRPVFERSDPQDDARPPRRETQERGQRYRRPNADGSTQPQTQGRSFHNKNGGRASANPAVDSPVSDVVAAMPASDNPEAGGPRPAYPSRDHTHRNRDRNRQSFQVPRKTGEQTDGITQAPSGPRPPSEMHRGRPSVPFADGQDRAGRRDGNRNAPSRQDAPAVPKKNFSATAAPKRASSAVDPDSPFAALSQLKERLEKQVQPQDETV